MMAICQILFSCIFNKIEPKTSVRANNKAKFMKRIIEQAGYNNFYKVLAYISTIDRPGQLTRVVDGIKLLKNICKAMLVYNKL